MEFQLLHILASTGFILYQQVLFYQSLIFFIVNFPCLPPVWPKLQIGCRQIDIDFFFLVDIDFKLWTQLLCLIHNYWIAGKESAHNADPGLIPGSGRSAGEGIGYPLQCSWVFPCGSAGKESTCNVGDLGLIPGMGKSPGEGKGYPLQYSGLENPMDCRVHEVTRSQTWLSNFHTIELFISWVSFMSLYL